MDKYEFNIKVEQIKKLVSRGDYDTAMKIADTIDWHRVRNASLLSMIAQIYEKNEEYQEAKDILLLAFERAPIGTRLLYKLTDLALKEGSIEEAEAYYREFCDLTQDDPRQYLLRYLILKAKKAPVDQLIRALETYTSIEMDEKWLYELAELYHKAGLEEKCVSTCDRIMLLFGLGKYVDKAMDLKLEYAPLNKYQMDLVENRDKYEAKLRAVEEEYSGGSPYQEDYEDNDTEKRQVPRYDMEKDAVMRLHEDVQAEKLAREMSRLSDEDMRTAEVEDDDMEATRTLDDIRSIKEIKPTRRVLDVAAERETVGSGREVERQREAIRAAKEREEMEEEALRRAEEEREAARREEAERRARKQAEIDRERALRQGVRTVAVEEAEEEIGEDEELDLESLDEGLDFNNLMIEADTDEEGLSLALEALKKIHRELGYKNPVAKISSEKLNKRGISPVVAKLAGKDLVIEHAAGLTDAVQNELDELMERDKTGMIVVLIDTPEHLEELHGRNASLASKFQYIGADSEAEKKRENAAVLEQALRKKTEAQEKIAKDVARTVEGEARKEIIEAEVPKEREIPAQEEEVCDDEPGYDGYETKEELIRQKRKSVFEGEKKLAERDYDEEDEDSEEFEEEPEEEPVKPVKAQPVKRAAVETVPGKAPKAVPKTVTNAVPASEPADDYDDKTEMDLDEFAQYACKYASEIDCSITGKSLLALYERIEMMEEDGVPLTKKTAVDLIEEAADKAEKPSLGKKLTGLFSHKYDKDGYLILHEDNFFD